MNAMQFVLALIHASGGRSVQGRTLLQKRAYFVSEISGIDPGLKFDAHYYGPYSAVVDGTVTQLKNLGFLEESTTGFGVVSGGFEMRRYDYKLTRDGLSIVEPITKTAEYGRIRQALEKMADGGDPNYVELSIAAKAYFILRKQQKATSKSELISLAKRFNWSITPESLESGVKFLQNVGLASEG
jgi:uncharacterized protein YwgA